MELTNLSGTDLTDYATRWAKGKCTGCGKGLLADGRWMVLTRPQRAELRGAGFQRHHGRHLCCVCYHHVKRAGTLTDYERNTYTNAEVIAEWTQLAAEGVSKRQAAARMGMSWAAFEKALNRAGVLSGPGNQYTTAPVSTRAPTTVTRSRTMPAAA